MKFNISITMPSWQRFNYSSRLPDSKTAMETRNLCSVRYQKHLLFHGPIFHEDSRRFSECVL